MIGAWSTVNCEVVDKEPLQLHKNFYRAIAEAQAAINGEVKAMSKDSRWAVMAGTGKKPKYLIVCEK